MGIDRAGDAVVSGYRNGGQSDFLRLMVIDSAAKRITQLQIDRDTMTPITILGVLGQDGGIDLSGMMGGMYMGASSATISVIPPWLVLGALVFAAVVGFVAGIVPANKAVKISALEAIRHD